MNINLTDLCLFLNFRDQHPKASVMSLDALHEWASSAKGLRRLMALAVRLPARNKQYVKFFAYLESTPPRQIIQSPATNTSLLPAINNYLEYMLNTGLSIQLELSNEELAMLEAGEVVTVKP